MLSASRSHSSTINRSHLALACKNRAAMGQIYGKRPRESCIQHCTSPGCIFCRVVKDSGKPNSRVVYEDALVVALPDIRPAAVQHLLVLPRAHIPNVTSLAASDTQLVRHMMAVGQRLLQQQTPHVQQQTPLVQQPAQPAVAGEQQQQDLEQQLWQQQQQLLLGKQQQHQPARLKFGFHKPPFRSVDHLHLHCFTLPHKWYRWGQYQCSLNWISADELLDELARKPSAKPQQQQQQQQQQAQRLEQQHSGTSGTSPGGDVC